MDNGMLQLLGAAGGMLGLIFSLLMLLLSILIPFFIWRIWKWSYTTSQELKNLNEKFDQLLLLQQDAGREVPSDDATTETAGFFAGTADGTATDEEPVAEDLAAETAAAMAAEDDVTKSPAESPASPVTDNDAGTSFEQPQDGPSADDGGFDFSIETGDFGEKPQKTTEEELFSADGDAFAAGDDDFAFDTNDEQTAEEAATVDGGQKTEATSAFGEEDDFAGAFREEEGAGEQPADTTRDDWGAAEDGDFAAFPADEPEEPAEEKPAIIALDPDPRRPDVKLARCGSCDHKLAYKEGLSGKKARCPSCKSPFVLP